MLAHEIPDITTASKAEVKDIMAECINDRALACKVLFPERFELPFSEKIHGKIFDMINSGVQRGAIAAPRGIGKTTVVNVAIPATEILFRSAKYIVPISATNTMAVQQSESLKWELMTNERIKKLFGNMQSNMFSKEQWTADNFRDDPRFPGTGVMPRGAGQQVRGMNYYGVRPDFIIVDDLEDPQHMDSEDQRLKKKTWFNADVRRAVARYKKDWRIFVIGTILHEDSLLNGLLESPDWESEMLELCDDDLVSNWPAYMSDADVKREYDEAVRDNMVDVFYRENRNLPGAKEAAGFKADDFMQYNESDITDPFHRIKDMPTAILIDPSKTVKMESAETGITGVGFDTIGNGIYVRDSLGLKLHPDEIYDVAIDMAFRLKADVIAVEVTSLNLFITNPLKNRMKERGYYGQLIELKAVGKKEDRIRAMVKYYRQHQVYHNTSRCGPVESQLLSFPRGRRVDVIDALAYFIPLMEDGELEFGPADWDEENDDPELEYAELEEDYDPVVEYERII